MSEKKKMNILLLKSLTCMICIMQRRARHVSTEAMQSTSRPAADVTFPDTQPISRHAIYTAVWLLQPGVRFVLHGVTGGPATSHGLEIWCPLYGHAAQRGWGIHYCGQDNSRASTDRGSLTRYMRGRAFDSAFKALCASWFALWLRWPSGVSYSYSANF